MATGYCKICASPLKGEVNRRLGRGETLAGVMAWLKGKDFPVSKPTLISHKKHITDPKTTFVDQARKNPAIKNVTEDEFLQSVIDAAAARVAASPDDVTIEQGLKAAGVRASRKEKTVNVLVAVARLVTQRTPLIEGEFTELDGSGEPIKELTTSE